MSTIVIGTNDSALACYRYDKGAAKDYIPLNKKAKDIMAGETTMNGQSKSKKGANDVKPSIESMEYLPVSISRCLYMSSRNSSAFLDRNEIATKVLWYIKNILNEKDDLESVILIQGEAKPDGLSQETYQAGDIVLQSILKQHPEVPAWSTNHVQGKHPYPFPCSEPERAAAGA